MDELTPEETKNCIKTLLEISQCPVCHEPMHTSQVCQCFIGHVFCKPCRMQIPRCPLCQGNFSSVKPLAFCQMLEALPQTCRHRGCTRIVRRGDDHEIWCGCREMKCLYCLNNFFGQDIPNHVKTQHKVAVTGHEDVTSEVTLPNFTCSPQTDLKINVARTKICFGLYFISRYYFNPAKKVLEVKVIFIPTGAVLEHGCLEGCLKIFSDSGIRFSVSKKLNMNVNTTETLFSIHESSLKEFAGCKNVSFRTVIRKPKAQKHNLSSLVEKHDGPSKKKVKE